MIKLLEKITVKNNIVYLHKLNYVKLFTVKTVNSRIQKCKIKHGMNY